MLEIGCGEGGRLEHLQKNYNLECFGVEPSKKAVEKAVSIGIEAKIGTADQLDFEDYNFSTPEDRVRVELYCLAIISLDLLVFSREAFIEASKKSKESYKKMKKMQEK